MDIKDLSKNWFKNDCQNGSRSVSHSGNIWIFHPKVDKFDAAHFNYIKEHFETIQYDNGETEMVEAVSKVDTIIAS